MKKTKLVVVAVIMMFLSLTGISTAAVEIRINSGGADYTDSSGNLFVADKEYEAGDFGYVGGKALTARAGIEGTEDDPLYQSLRTGNNVSYQFDNMVEDDYEITLYFMEPFQTSEGERLFDVIVEGEVVLDDYDIYAAAGGKLTAVSETLVAHVADGQLNIEFVGVNNKPFISGIAVVSTGGTEPEPDISVSPSSLDYGDVEVGTTSEMDVTLSNDGTADLTVSDLSISSGEFTVLSPATPVTLTPGGTQVVTVQFSPTATGAASGSLDISSDDPDEGVVNVSLSGNGIEPPPDEPDISVSPGNLDYGDVVVGTTSEMDVTLSNDGTADLTVSDLSISSGEFTVLSPATPVTLGPGGTQVVTVQFSPTATGAASGSLDISSDDPDEGVVNVSLSGNGIEPPPDEPDISVSPLSVDFGQVVVGSSADQTLTISNDGTQLLSVTDLSTTNGVFTIVDPAVPFDVSANGGSQVVTVRFSPDAEAVESGELTISSNDPDEGTVTILLSGEGTTSSSTTTYANVTSQLGITANHTLHATVCDKPPIGSGSAWGDYDNDGDADVYMTNHGGANYLYRNDGDTDSDGLPNFTNVAGSLGVENASLLSLSVVFIDYDNDGDQDLYVTNWDANTLFQNQLIETGSVAFVDVTATAGVADAGRAITTAWADFNQDGHLDFYVGKHRRCAGDPQSEDHLYQSNGDGTFTNVTSYLCDGASSCAQVLGLAFAPGFFDYDNDGDLDLYLVNDDIGGSNYPNVLWRNDGADGSGGWIFTDVSTASGLDVSLNGMGLGVGDFDHDGFFDVAFSNIAPGKLMHNNGDGTFTDISDSSGVTVALTQGTWGTAFFDYDNDNDVDLYYVAGGIGSQTEDHPNVLLSNDGNGATFTNVSVSSGANDSGWGRSASIVDFDGDGWVDFVIGNYSDGYYVYRNGSADQGNTNHWLAITVEGTESNRDAIGTRISITADGVTQIREISSGPTHGGGDYRAAYFGLGSETSATVTIQWPNGVVEDLGSVSADQTIHRVEPSSNPQATTYVDVTTQVGMTLGHTLDDTICDPPLGSGSAWADYDNDGDIDLYATNHGGANWFYRNDGDTNGDGLPDFTDIAASLGLDDPTGIGHAAVFIDYDNDGDQDLFKSNWGGNSLYENQLIETGSATFIDVTATAGIGNAGRAITAAWADFNQDGWLDLYLAKHLNCAGDPQNQDYLFQNNGDGTFSDATGYLCGGASTCAAVEGLGFAPGFFDMDNDGDLDLYLVNDNIGGQYQTNILWRNDGSDGSGGWIFTDVSVSSGTNLDVNGMGLGIGDYDNDGWLDLAFSDLDPAHLLQNNGDGTFTDVSGTSDVTDATTDDVTWGTAFLDHDNDGWLDLFLMAGNVHQPAAEDPNVFLTNNGDGAFTDTSVASGLNEMSRGRNASIVDFDQDGFVDVFAGNYGYPSLLFHNEGAAQGNSNHWLTITVEGTESNRDAIGTRILLTANGVTQIREISSGPTHGGGDYRAAYFGLGADTGGTLEIQWPNGVVENLGTVAADQHLHLVEPSS